MSNPSRPSSSPSVATHCAKCGEAFTTERPATFVGDNACGRWKPRFSAHLECIEFTGVTAAPSSSERAPTSSEIATRIAELEKSCRCLYIAVDGVIADDVKQRADAVIADLRSALASSPVVPEPVEATYDERALWCSCGVFLPDVTDGIAMHKESCPRFEYASVKRAMADQRARINAAQSAINKACAIIELGDERLLRCDGPAGGQPPDLTLSEWRELYVTLDAARSSSPVTPEATSEDRVDAERWRLLRDRGWTVGYNEMADTPRPKGSRGPYFCETHDETYYANSVDDAIAAARSTPTGESNG